MRKNKELKWKLHQTAFSKCGTRPGNEDSYRLCTAGAYRLYIVADGLGGHQAGEVASAFVTEKIAEAFAADPDGFDAGQVIMDVNAALCAYNEAHRILSRTTVCLACIGPETTVCAHVGDSRIYCIKDGEIVYRSKDHSVGQMAVSLGEITDEELRTFEDRSILTRCVGVPDLKGAAVRCLKNDAYDMGLLCSDGFWEPLSDAQIAELSKKAAGAANREKACGRWLSAMKAQHKKQIRGRSCDNYTAVIF